MRTSIRAVEPHAAADAAIHHVPAGYMLHPATRKEQGKKNKTHAHVVEYVEKMEVRKAVRDMVKFPSYSPCMVEVLPATGTQ